MRGKRPLLTKSRFKVGCECPTKLYYLDKKEYANSNSDNPFLEALAEGGFQVGALAKLYYPGGHEVSSLVPEEALKATNELLSNENATIYEAAISWKKLFVRVDILRKNGTHIDLIEVKAKSFDPSEEDLFLNKSSLKKGEIKPSSEWAPYLLDIAFQTYVFKMAFPNHSVSSHLMLADKSSVATVDGLNQLFVLRKDDRGRSYVEPSASLSSSDLGAPVLKAVCVDEIVQALFTSTINETHSFDQYVEFLSGLLESDTRHRPQIGSHCKTCEFRVPAGPTELGLKSGFNECWSDATKLSPSDLEQPLVLDVWNFRKAETLIQKKQYLISQISKSDISPKPADAAGLSPTERQWLQVEMAQNGTKEPYIDIDGLSSEFGKWSFPLHFIDFETTMVAIPFHRGRRPYEQMAFQFSHHVIHSDGRIEHKTQYLNKERGLFPNFDFVRALKQALSGTTGTIFRYAAHENTVLCQIYDQLSATELPVVDKNELLAWIKTVTTSSGSRGTWTGQRNMVDMCELVKRYFYHPEMGGSNSIKKVLPAVLGHSRFLKGKYSQPIYGSASGIRSLNFRDHKWIVHAADGSIVDPYKLLPPVFEDLTNEEMDKLLPHDSIADGGAAMTAYARMQFSQMSEAERDRICASLLKYCELDTFAMVLIYEYWKHEIAQTRAEAA